MYRIEDAMRASGELPAVANVDAVALFYRAMPARTLGGERALDARAACAFGSAAAPSMAPTVVPTGAPTLATPAPALTTVTPASAPTVAEPRNSSTSAWTSTPTSAPPSAPPTSTNAPTPPPSKFAPEPKIQSLQASVAFGLLASALGIVALGIRYVRNAYQVSKTSQPAPTDTAIEMAQTSSDLRVEADRLVTSHQDDALRQIPGDVLAVPSWIPGARKQQAYHRVANDEAVDPDDDPFDEKAEIDHELPE